ncbi:hypothetical protein ACFS07_14820 [Undibacterium arcticum]
MSKSQDAKKNHQEGTRQNIEGEKKGRQEGEEGGNEASMIQ